MTDTPHEIPARRFQNSLPVQGNGCPAPSGVNAGTGPGVRIQPAKDSKPATDFNARVVIDTESDAGSYAKFTAFNDAPFHSSPDSNERPDDHAPQ